MQSGIVYGYAEMVCGMVRRLKAEIGATATVIATGGYAGVIAGAACCIDAVETISTSRAAPGLRGEPVSAPTLPLSGRTIVLGVSGSIAAYKAVEVTSRLVQAGAAVEVVMTAAATKFIGPLTFRGITGREPFVDLWAAAGPTPSLTSRSAAAPTSI